MKITKLGHSCLLVETPERTALFDPGVYSQVNIDSLEFLDDIFITHEHPDHFDVELVKTLISKFPGVRIKAPGSFEDQLKTEGITFATGDVEGVELFSPLHEGKQPFFNPPEQIGIHYLDTLTHPGDSHSFNETKSVLALPITAPWGSTGSAVELALALKPKHILPIHDWHWRDEAREQMYKRLEQFFAEQGIKFYMLENGKPISIVM